MAELSPRSKKQIRSVKMQLLLKEETGRGIRSGMTGKSCLISFKTLHICLISRKATVKLKSKVL